MKVIDPATYITDMEDLYGQISSNMFRERFDCIIALKRSGWILGIYLSNKLSIPVFTPSEKESIPPKFKRILIVDDAICKGKAMRKVSRTIKDCYVRWAVLYIEGDAIPEYFVRRTGTVKMWYEKLDPLTDNIAGTALTR